MKRVFFFMALIVIYCNSLAQQTVYKSIPELEKFTGSWVYKKDGKEIKIILKKVKLKLGSDDIYIDVIEGYHSYKNNNKIIEASQEQSEKTLTRGFLDREDPNKVQISVSDHLKKKVVYAILTYIPGDTPKLQCLLINREGIRVRKLGDEDFDNNFTLPKSMIFQREN